MNPMTTSSVPLPGPVDANDGDEIQAARTVAEQGAPKPNVETFSEWDQVGNCSCLDQVKAATPKSIPRR